MQIQEKPYFTEAMLFEKFGSPAPTISQVSRFLCEVNTTTWRRVQRGELEVIAGTGTTRITLASLAALLNGRQPKVSAESE